MKIYQRDLHLCPGETQQNKDQNTTDFFKAETMKKSSLKIVELIEREQCTIREAENRELKLSQ